MRQLLSISVVLALLVLTSTGCQQGGSPTGQPAAGASGDGFAVGSTQLALLAAPPGLCEGDGADKECEGECQSQTPLDGAGMLGAGAGFGNSAGTGAPGLGAPSGAGGASGFGSFAGMGGSAPQPEPDDDALARDAGCGVPNPDAGAGDMCMDEPDAAVAASAALALPDVPSCADLDTSEPYTLYMSADDSNSMASPVIARRLIRQGLQVPARIVRAYEFLNYYSFDFEPAAPGEVRIAAQLSSCPTDGQLSFQVALQAEARDPAQRRPLNLTFVLDTSGSMAGQPLLLQAAAMRAIASQLREGDVVSMVTWDVAQRDVLTQHAISGPDDAALLQAVSRLDAAGGTDFAGGLRRGYQLAQAQYSPERINRVVVISDGIANVGITDEMLIGEHADDEEGQEGIYLAGIGVGDGVNDTLMNTVTDAGRGAYVYLDSEQEAQRMLGDRFLSVVDLAARAVRLEVTLPYYLTLEKFFGEIASTDASKVRPQHLGPNDAMLFFQVLKACDASLMHGDDRIRVRATWETPFTRQAREAEIDTTLNALAGDDAALTKAAAIAGYAEALVAVQGVTDVAARRAILSTALDNVRAAEGASSDPDLLEVAELLEAYRSIVAP